MRVVINKGYKISYGLEWDIFVALFNVRKFFVCLKSWTCDSQMDNSKLCINVFPVEMIHKMRNELLCKLGLYVETGYISAVKGLSVTFSKSVESI